MKSKVFKITTIAILIAFLIVGLLVSVSIWNSRTVAIRQAQQNLSNMCARYAESFDASFTESELVVNSLASTVEQEYTVADYIGNRPAFAEKKAATKRLMKEICEQSPNPLGLYLTFDPVSSGGEDEVWYVKGKDGRTEYLDSIALSDSWLREDDPDAEYYYDTLAKGRAVWSEASFDPGMEGSVVSYTRPLYDSDGEVIGVLGADILVDHIFTSLKDIDKETGGKSALIENEYGIVSGVDPADYEDTSKYFTAREKFGDRWTMVLIQPVQKAIGSVMATAYALILLGILILLAAVITIHQISRRTVQPIIAEAELKDAMMIHQARQAKMGEMVGNIAHQWKQPLNGIRMSLMNMADDWDEGMLDDETFEDYVLRMNQMVTHLADTADDFTAFLRPTKKPEKFSVLEETGRMIRLMDEQIRLAGITIETEGPEIVLEGYRNEFGQCMFNLIDNARDALREHAKAGPMIRITTEKEEDRCRVRVFNNGIPIAEEHMEHLFELYFTTKEDDGGTGIGLYLAREIIRSHFGGELYARNIEDGVEFVIEVPVVPVAPVKEGSMR